MEKIDSEKIAETLYNHKHGYSREYMLRIGETENTYPKWDKLPEEEKEQFYSITRRIYQFLEKSYRGHFELMALLITFCTEGNFNFNNMDGLPDKVRDKYTLMTNAVLNNIRYIGDIN